jgi:hypothetical protein
VQEEVPAAAAPGEPMDLNTAIQVVMKKALAHDGLARGLHESARSIERGQAQVGCCCCCWLQLFLCWWLRLLLLQPL